MHKSALLSAAVCFSALGFTVMSLAASSADKDALAHAQRLQLEYRQGNRDAVGPLVHDLELAVARSPDNADLWEAMGHAYMSQQGASLSSPPDMPKLIAIGQRARDAYARSLALDPNDMLVRASHGMSQMVVSQLTGDGPGVMAGVEEMNAAVRQAPKTTGVRLTRAFTIIQLPPDMRDTDAVIDDLQFILDTAPNSRPQDVLHLMLGDVHAEMGRPEQAKTEYMQVTGASAFAAEQVKLRLAELQKGPVSPAAIAQVRAITGSGCVMCHAPGKDN